MTDLDNREWIQLVKLTRQTLGVSLDDTHDLVLADEEMRCFVAWRINYESECRKQALWDMRHKAVARAGFAKPA
jgi:hypothetical protein